MSRISKHKYFLEIAQLTSLRSTCIRRAVGCVLVNKHFHVIATGYNGVPRGHSHCNEGNPCVGANSPSGTNLSSCNAIHAEINALLQCKDINDIYIAYVTHSPCIECAKALSNTSCEQIIFLHKYAHDEISREIFMKTNLIKDENGNYLTNRSWVNF